MIKKHHFLAVAAAMSLSVMAMAKMAVAEVTVLGWPGGAEETALRATVDIYNARLETGEADKVSLLFFNREGFYDKLQADMAAGSDAFDINLIATYAIGRYAPFMDVIDLGENAHQVFTNPILQTMQFENQQYGVPTDLSLHFMYYRKDLTDALLGDARARATYAQIAQKYLGKNLEPKDPDQWSWDDWAATALYFTKSVNPDSPVRYGTVLQMKNLLFNMMVFQSLPRAYGGDWMDEAGEITIDSPAYRYGLELYKILYDAGATPRDSMGYEYSETNAAWVSGQVATALQWNAAAGELTNIETAPNVAENTHIIAPPAGPQGRQDHIHGLGLGLNKNAKNKQGAIRFLQWLASEEAILTYAKAGGSPALTPHVVEKIATERPDLVQLGTFAGSYGYVMRGATSAHALSVYEAQAREFTAYWSGRKTLDEALTAVKNSMEALLK